MRSIVVTCVLLLACASVCAQSTPCESFGGYRECRIATNGRARLVMELSNHSCYEDLTWGARSNGTVWVDRGCRAKFRIDSLYSSTEVGGARIVCESLDGRLEVCRADGGRGVELARQLSRTACLEGKDWGYSAERAQIWVDHGCRAEFVLGRLFGPALPVEPLETTVICESPDRKRRDCAADTTAGVQIVRELGDKPCAFGRDWGFDTKKNEIWVTRGCRAEFAVRGKPMVSTVVCESDAGARKHCEAGTELGVALVKVLGESRCVLGTTWGFDDEGVWVSGGCRAQFALGGFRLPESAVPKSAARVVCASELGNLTQCPTDTARGVGLVRQLGESPCVLNRTWGYGAEGIWVSEGCRAEFAVAR